MKIRCTSLKMSLDKKEQRKREFESELINIYDITIPNGMNYIHENEVNKIAECMIYKILLNTLKI